MRKISWGDEIIRIILEDINYNRKYSLVDIGFTVNEIDPIDATMVQELGSWRTIPKTLERRIYKG